MLQNPTWGGAKPRKSDVEIAKNYLTQDELDALNRIVTIYLDFAELQALNQKAMYMRDWIAKLDDFLRLSERDILTYAGKISHETALSKAHAEYKKYHTLHADDRSPVEKHFLEAIEEMKKLERGKNKQK